MAQLKLYVRSALQIVVLLAVLGAAWAQDSAFYAWSLDETGAPQLEALAPGEGYSINDVMGEHFPGVRFMAPLIPLELSEGDDAAVMFRWLTDEPLVVLTKYPERAAAYVASFDLSEYLNSWRLSNAIEYAMQYDEMPVTDLEILTALGAPSSRVTRTTETGQGERWEYAQYRLVLYFSRGALVEVVTY